MSVFSSIFGLQPAWMLADPLSILKRVAAFALTVTLAFGLLAGRAHADVWGYVDDKGVAHFATEKVDARYELFFRGATVTSGGNPAAAAPAPGPQDQKLVAFFEVSANYKAVRHLLKEAAQTNNVDYELLKAVIVTESGFGADIGMEKFFDIKCRTSGLVPDCVVLVATIRALKMHGGGPRVIPGRPLDKAYTDENVALLEKGMANMVAHIRNAKRFGVPVVVAVNKFHTDTAAEIAAVEQAAMAAGAETAVMTDHWANGGDGAVALAEAVVAACEKPSNFEFLYPLDLPIKAKIETIAKQIYSAGEVIYEPQAEKQIKSYEDNGFGNLPICMAKTHLSISHDPALKNAPSGYTLTVREVRASVGAGFIYPLLGEMRTMPGLGTRPAYMNVDIDENGRVMGLF